MAKLTDKQAMFIAEYMVDKNATQAAIRAGYSEDTAQQIGSENLSKPVIFREIEKRLKEQVKRLEITSDRILLELYSIAKVDIRKAFNKDGTLKAIHEIPADVAKALAGIDVEESWKASRLEEGDSGEQWKLTTKTKKIRLVDKTKALQLLGEHLKLFTQKHEIGDPDGKPLSVPVITIHRVVMNKDGVMANE